MARVNEGQVRAIVDSTLDINMDPFIGMATRLVDRVATCATAKDITLTDNELADLEKLLAAHFYCLRDPTYKSRSTADASGAFNQESYLETAKQLDYSGCLQDILEKKQARVYWGGKTEASRLTYDERNP